MNYIFADIYKQKILIMIVGKAECDKKLFMGDRL